MPRKTNTKRTETLTVNPDRAPAPSVEGQAVLEALRSNLGLLGELATRYEVATRPEGPDDPPSIGSPHDVYRLLAPEMSALAQEQLRVLLIDTKGQVVGQRVIYQGNISSAIVRTAEVFRPAVIEAVPSVIVAHNHPSKDPDPSPEDVMITRKLKQAAELLDIELLDHIVIGGKRHVSLKNRGLMS